MSHLRQLSAATFLTLTLTVSAWAGQMETPNTAQSPSLSSPAEPQILVVEETPTNDQPAVEPVIEIGLSILQAMLSVL